MSNLPYHRPPEFEIFRNESQESQNRRKRIRESQTKSSSDGTCRNDGLWWNEQRWLSQTVPAEMVNPDTFNTAKYRYQVYARPPPGRCDPCDLSQVSDEPAPMKYNVHRVAIDAPLPCSSTSGRTNRNTSSNNIRTIQDNIAETAPLDEHFDNDVNSQRDQNANNNNDDIWSTNATDGSSQSSSYTTKSKAYWPEYGTFRIICGQQYREDPGPNLADQVQLPPAVEEYRAFQRRCPNYRLGRYDRSSGLNDMKLSATKYAVTIPSTETPFNFMKNPHRGEKPLLFSREVPQDMDWPMSNKCM